VTHPFQQRRISASAVRASKKVELSRTGSRLRAFQRAIDEVRMLHLTPERVVVVVVDFFFPYNKSWTALTSIVS